MTKGDDGCLTFGVAFALPRVFHFEKIAIHATFRCYLYHGTPCPQIIRVEKKIVLHRRTPDIMR